MSHKLLGKAIGDEIVTFMGPINGRNFNVQGLATAITPAIEIQVIGGGEVKIQQTNTYENRGNAGTNAYTFEQYPTGWADLGDVIDASDGLVVRNPTPDNYYRVIRVVVTGVGDGRVIVRSQWN